MRILMLCDLAFSCYQTQEWDKTLALVKEIDQRSEAILKNWQGPDQGLRQWVLYTRPFESYIKHWKQDPLVVKPENIRIVVGDGATEPTSTKKRISLRTFQPASFKLTVDNPHIKASLTQGSWTGIRRHYAEQEVTIEVEPQALAAGQEQVTAMLTVTLEQKAPNQAFEMRVPLTIARSATP